LLALPVTAVVMVLLRYAYAQYTASNLYGAEKPVVVLPGNEQATETPGTGIDV